MRSRTPFPSAALGPPAYGWPVLGRLATVLAPAFLAVAMGCREDAQSPTAPQPAPALATSSTALSFGQVSAGYNHTCGVTVSNRAYCWGNGFFGQLGNGTATDRLTPVAVAGGLRFRQVSAGTDHTCGVTPGNRLYCWGANTYGDLGDGTTTPRLAPVAVAGGLRFRQVVAANAYTCGVTLDNRAYCWGTSSFGEIGDGTRGTQHLTPVAVIGGLRFRQVSAALLHTCGVTLDNLAYCWGSNSNGQLGGGPPGDLSLTPVRVVGGLRFRRVIAGFSHTCGVTAGNRAYCWGFNLFGQLGDGTAYPTNTQRLTPVAVAGGLRFREVGAAGEYHTCGVTTGNQSYCWGLNRDGQLGDGTITQRLTPVAVTGELRFHQVSARFHHTCGVTLGHRVYCWGSNSDGQLGDGTTTTRLTPVAVASPAP
jgi:alpha-tubulin suppressor-like RCC1 family protein